MKRKEFIRELEKSGCVLHRHGSRHDIYLNPATGQKSPVPTSYRNQEQLMSFDSKTARLNRGVKMVLNCQIMPCKRRSI